MREHTAEVMIGDVVIVTKEFGPLWAADLKVSMDFDGPEPCWVVERSVVDSPYGIQWQEIARTPFCTEDDEFGLARINGD